MNCPSRTDDTLVHPSWNQSPRHLTADLTTRQDFNGAVNTRGRRDGLKTAEMDDREVEEQLGGSEDGALHHFEKKRLDRAQVFRAWLRRDLLHLGADASSHSLYGAFKSFLLVIGTCLTVVLLYFTLSEGLRVVLEKYDEMTKYGMPSGHLLHRRATPTTCGRGRPLEGYNVPFHVGALFIVLFVSSSACAFPMIVIKFPRLRIPSSFLFLARHFGTGVLLATAFAHLLPTAFLSLTDSCLPPFWNNDYPAMAGVMALGAVFLVAVVEMVFTPDIPCQSHRSHATNGTLDCHALHPSNSDDLAGRDLVNSAMCPAAPAVTSHPVSQNKGLIRDLGPLKGRSNSLSRGLVRMGQESDRLDRIEVGEKLEEGSNRGSKDVMAKAAGDCLELLELTPKQKHKKAVMQCMLLEMGILFHSVFIGMALSVSVGNEFVVLLIAIAFHQTFEGLALGSRIASIEWNANALQPWIMALAYGCTTPIGQAIGLATHTLYDPNSQVGLLMVGTMNAISSGLLIYASLVELLSEDFLSDESWRVLKGKKRVFACFLVFMGAVGMSLIGAWA